MSGTPVPWRKTCISACEARTVQYLKILNLVQRAPRELIEVHEGRNVGIAQSKESN